MNEVAQVHRGGPVHAEVGKDQVSGFLPEKPTVGAKRGFYVKADTGKTLLRFFEDQASKRRLKLRNTNPERADRFQDRSVAAELRIGF